MPNYTFVTPRFAHKTQWIVISLSLVLLSGLFVFGKRSAPPKNEAAAAPAAARLQENYGQVPLHFEANQGQFDEPVKYLSRGRGYSIAFTPQAAVLALQGERAATVQMKLKGANPNPRLSSAEPLAAKMNYFLGNDPKQWKTDVPTFAKVKYEQVYPGTDVVYYGNQQQLEYDFIVAPNADPQAIKLEFDGVTDLRLDEAGNLLLATEAGEVKQHKPIVYQEVAGQRREIRGSYRIEQQEVSFELGEYDRSLPLVIDPVIAYATLVSSAGVYDTSIKVDADGNAYIAGWAANKRAAITAGAVQVVADHISVNSTFGYVAKFNSTGTNLIYAAMIGGVVPTKVTGSPRNPELRFSNACTGIAIDAQGNAYLTGTTDTPDFPTTPGAFQRTRSADSIGLEEGFVVKLSPTGRMVYSTLLGYAIGKGIAVDAEGQAVIIGTTSSVIPVKEALQATHQGYGDAFVTKLNATGTGLIYSTYLGSGSSDNGSAVAVDAQGNAFIAGYTDNGRDRDSNAQIVWGTRFPTTPGAFLSSEGQVSGMFVAKLTPGGRLIYSTLLLRHIVEVWYNFKLRLGIDAAGCAYIQDNAIYKLNAEGSGLHFSLPYTMISTRAPRGMAVDPAGNIYSATATGQVVKLSGQGLKTLYSITIPYSDLSDLAVDPAGNAYVTGIAIADSNFTTTPNAYWSERQPEQHAAFVAKISETAPPPPPAAYSIRGTVSLRTGQPPYAPSEGVKVVLQGAVNRTTLTDSFGRYLFELVPAGGDYTVVPDPANYLASPGSASVSKLSANQVLNFEVSNKEAHFVSHVSAASYNPGPLATESIVSAFGTNLTPVTERAAELPLPTELGGTRIKVKDSAGTVKSATLLFVSPTQINYVMPALLASGPGIVTVTSADGTTSKEVIQIETTTPGLFSADSTGRGVAAAKVQRVKANGTQTIEDVVAFDPIRGQLVAIPIDLGPVGDKVYLTLYGTGVRHRVYLSNVSATIGGRTATVSYAGSQNHFAGLDQINVMIPRELAGRGDVDVVLSVEGKPANTVRVKIK